MANRYFNSLPEGQIYLYKNFIAVGKMEGTICDECGAYIRNIVTVVGSVDHIEYELGLTCCEKQGKVGDVKFDDKVGMQVKFWKSRLSKLNKFRKDFDKMISEDSRLNQNGKPDVIQGKFTYDIRKKCALIDFGALYPNGNWRWLHEDFPITKIYDKVKDVFADVWDQIDWMGFDDCASVSTSKDVCEILQTKKWCGWNKWNEVNYPDWDQKSDCRGAIELAIDGSGHRYGPGVSVKLPKWFNPYDYPEGLFDEVVVKMSLEYPALDQTEFIITNDEALKRAEIECV